MTHSILTHLHRLKGLKLFDVSVKSPPPNGNSHIMV